MSRDDHKQWVSQVFDRAAPEYRKKISFFSYFRKRLLEALEIHLANHAGASPIFLILFFVQLQSLSALRV
jgi:hypothetical protein